MWACSPVETQFYRHFILRLSFKFISLYGCHVFHIIYCKKNSSRLHWYFLPQYFYALYVNFDLWPTWYFPLDFVILCPFLYHVTFGFGIPSTPHENLAKRDTGHSTVSGFSEITGRATKKHFKVSIKILFAFFKYIFTFSFCLEIRMLDRQHWNILFLSYWRFSTTSHVRSMVENIYSNLCFPSLSIVLFNIHGKVFYMLISHFQCFYNFKLISQACNK